MRRSRSIEASRSIPTIRRTPGRALTALVLATAVAGGVARGLEGPAVEPPAYELTVIVKPRLSRGFSMLQSLRLNRALRLASRRLLEKPACQELFGNLGADGIRTLRATIYQLAGKAESLPCRRRGVAASTRVGSITTSLCPAFLRLSPQSQATVLLHEGLHHAGLSERPIDADAMTSREITRLVRSSCGL